MVLSERSRPCPNCGWIMHEDGTCGRCRADAAAPSCPPIETWDPRFKAWLVRSYMTSVMGTHGDDAARMQQAAEKMVKSVVLARGLALRMATPTGECYRLALELFNRTVPADAGRGAT